MMARPPWKCKGSTPDVAEEPPAAVDAVQPGISLEAHGSTNRAEPAELARGLARVALT